MAYVCGHKHTNTPSSLFLFLFLLLNQIIFYFGDFLAFPRLISWISFNVLLILPIIRLLIRFNSFLNASENIGLNRRIHNNRLEWESERVRYAAAAFTKLHLNCMLIWCFFFIYFFRFFLIRYTENREHIVHFKRGKHLKLWWVRLLRFIHSTHTHAAVEIIISTAIVINMFFLLCVFVFLIYTRLLWWMRFDPPDMKTCTFFVFTVNHWLIESFLNSSHCYCTHT